MAYSIPPDLLETIRREWHAAGGREKNAVLGHHASAIGCSIAALRYRLNKNEPRKKDLSRCPQAEKKIPEYVIDAAEDIIARGYALNPDGRRISATRIIAKLARRGVPSEHLPSATTLNARLARRGHGEKQRRSIVEADHALQRVQIDFSRSEHFQVKRREPDGRFILVVSSGSMAYKDDNRALRTWYASAVDDYSRMHHARIYVAAGESGSLGLQFLSDLLTPDAEDEGAVRHFYHLAHTYQTDRGAFFSQQATAVALESVGSRLVAATKEGQGKVENRFRHLWRDFELDLAEDMGAGATIALDELNDLLRHWCIEEGRTRRHPTRPKLTREQSYLLSLRDYPPVVLDDPDLLKVAFRVAERKVDAHGHVSLDNVRLAVPRRIDVGDGRTASVPPGTWLRVMPNLRGEYRAVLRDRYSAPFVLTAYEQPRFGDFSHGPHATADAAVERRINARQPGAASTARHLPADRNEVKAKPEAPALPPNVVSLFAAPTEPERRVADSPFVAAGVPTDRLTPTAAKLYVGRYAEQIGKTYADVAYAFDALCAGTPDAPGATRADLDAAIGFLFSTHARAV